MTSEWFGAIHAPHPLLPWDALSIVLPAAAVQQQLQAVCTMGPAAFEQHFPVSARPANGPVVQKAMS